MHLTPRTITWADALHGALIFAVVIGFPLVGGACDSGGGGVPDDSAGGGAPDVSISAPSNLKATVDGAVVKLTWDTEPGAENYKLYRDTSSLDSVSGDPLASGISPTTYEDAPGAVGTTYFYRVTATNSDTTSGPSGEVQATPVDASAPSAPSGLTTDVGDGEVALSWDSPGSDAATYSVYRGTTPTNSISGSPLESDLSSTGYTDSTPANGTAYYYWITATDDSGNESRGSGAAKSTPFTAPTGLTGTSEDGEIKLNWSAASGAANYNVYRDTAPISSTSGSSPLESGVPAASYTDDTAANRTKYYYRVTSVNPEGEESSLSNEIAKTPFESPDRP